ncbi:MAG: hypothetical protein K8S22_14435 [Betaproteobacteria bacterium]|nr:hypothetical protein [Betaproteobacteria bacterium]
MKPISILVLALFAALAPAVVLAQSVPDANPECMERNGPDCVLPSALVPQRAGPPIVVVPPIVVPPVTPPAGTVSPQATLPPRGTAPSSGIVGSPEPVPPAAPASTTPGSSNVIVPSGQGSAIISPRK